MMLKNVKIGESYAHIDREWTWFFKPVKIHPPKTGINRNHFPIVECEYTQSKDGLVGRIVYVKPKELKELK